MIIGTEFIGDQDEELKRLQRQMYVDLLPNLLIEARRAYLRAEEMLDQSTNLGRKIQQMSNELGFDHRILQEVHDIIAACFRFKRPDLLQLTLEFEHKDPIQRIQDEWCRFFSAEAQHLAQCPDFTRALLTAVGYHSVVAAQLAPGTDLGSQAEEVLKQFLLEEYSALFESDVVGTSRWKKSLRWPTLPSWLIEPYSE
jgi:hypothetical protein